MTANHKPYGEMKIRFPVQQSIKRIIWDYKSKKQEMSGSIAQMAEQSAVNRCVEGSIPSVPVWFAKNSNVVRKICVIGSNPIIPTFGMSPGW